MSEPYTKQKDSNDNSATIDVLIIGGGPTGLTAAAEALRQNLTVRVIDRKKSRVINQSRALAVHARTLELLNAPPPTTATSINSESAIESSIASRLISKGILVKHVNMNTFNEVNTVDIENLPWDDAHFPHLLSLPQYDTEIIIEGEVKRLGGTVEWNTSLKSINDNDNDSGVVTSILSLPDGTEEQVRSRWAIGCDGGRSRTRQCLGIELNRDQTDVSVIVADFKICNTNEFLSHDEFHVYIDAEGFLGLIPIGDNDHQFRLVMRAPPGDIAHEKEPQLTADYFSDTLNRRLRRNRNSSSSSNDKWECHDLTWAASFQVSYGVADKYRLGRIFLAGDACHVHSPAGGQGMNYGIQDAINLVWKLAWAKRCGDIEGDNVESVILESYEVERRALALSMVDGTRMATNVGMSINFILTKLKEWFLPYLVRSDMAKGMISHKMSMIDVRYGDKSPLVMKDDFYFNGVCCRPGDRLPNLITTSGKKLYDVIDRSRHSWVMVTGKDDAKYDGDNSGTPGELKVINVIHKERIKQHVLLVRPDLYVMAVHTSIDDLWMSVGELLGDSAQQNM